MEHHQGNADLAQRTVNDALKIIKFVPNVNQNMALYKKKQVIKKLENATNVQKIAHFVIMIHHFV